MCQINANPIVSNRDSLKVGALTIVRSLRGGGLCLDPTSVEGKDKIE